MQLTDSTWSSEDSDSNEIEVSAEKLQYYVKFLHVLNALQYDNLHTLMPYENDTSMQKLPLVAMLFELLPPRLRRRPKLVNSLTEMGLCRTSSQRANFGFPFDKQLKWVISNMYYILFILCYLLSILAKTTQIPFVYATTSMIVTCSSRPYCPIYG